MTDIILTIGPSSDSPEILERMCRIATRFRLNTGHISGERLRELLDRLSMLFTRLGRALPVVLDLQGAKIRIGEYPSVEHVPSFVTLRLGTSSDDPSVIPVPHACIFRETQPGDLLHVNDRRVILRVTERLDEHSLRAECLQQGPLSSRKGLNSPGREFPLDAISSADRGSIDIGNQYPFVEYAVSFVRDGLEAQFFRAETATRKLIAKIERPAALSSLVQIDQTYDEHWLCRGDLGAEIDIRNLGKTQKTFVDAFPTLRKPKILAGEVLGSTVCLPFPTRSEIVHLYDSLLAGFDGFVLSDETAQGHHVPEVLNFLEHFFKEEKATDRCK
ncbi:MAG: pyruvate kinase [Candidatus Ozemobacteraceae bacterium]